MADGPRVRLWTVHPKYLDAAGLCALWREGLLAQQVLRGRTRGYRHHPQLERFRAHARPRICIASYLREVYREATTRGYRFDRSKIGAGAGRCTMRETRGQLMHEWSHLKRKLVARSRERFRKMRGVHAPEPHPMFRIVPGAVRDWERGRSR